MIDKRFSYYSKLSAADKVIYRKSDAIREVKVPNLVSVQPLVDALNLALESGVRVRVGRAATALCDALVRQLSVPKVQVRVREVRPDIRGGELHGLYTFATKKSAPTIEVWMRTNSKERVVKFRTFLRTLMHEVGHHLDVTLFALGDSFHNEGFFRRESSLVRQLTAHLVPMPKKRKQSEPKEFVPAPKAPRTSQLSLF